MKALKFSLLPLLAGGALAGVCMLGAPWETSKAMVVRPPSSAPRSRTNRVTRMGPLAPATGAEVSSQPARSSPRSPSTAEKKRNMLKAQISRMIERMASKAVKTFPTLTDEQKARIRPALTKVLKKHLKEPLSKIEEEELVTAFCQAVERNLWFDGMQRLSVPIPEDSFEIMLSEWQRWLKLCLIRPPLPLKDRQSIRKQIEELAKFFYESAVEKATAKEARKWAAYIKKTLLYVHENPVLPGLKRPFTKAELDLLHEYVRSGFSSPANLSVEDVAKGLSRLAAWEQSKPVIPQHVYRKQKKKLERMMREFQRKLDVEEEKSILAQEASIRLERREAMDTLLRETFAVRDLCGRGNLPVY